MPKITRYGGHSIAGITDTATGQTERGRGLVEDTDAIQAKADGLIADSNSPEVELPFDPGTLSVADVNMLLEDASDDEREAVLQAEREGKNRKGIVGE